MSAHGVTYWSREDRLFTRLDEWLFDYKNYCKIIEVCFKSKNLDLFIKKKNFRSKPLRNTTSGKPLKFGVQRFYGKSLATL